MLRAFGLGVGAGNIGDAGSKSLGRSDADLIPEAAKRSEDSSRHHTGRGGAGNEEKPVKTGDSYHAPVGLADKLKAKLFGKK